MSLFAATAFYFQSPTEDGPPPGPVYAVRTDAYSASLKLAIVGSVYSTLGMTNFTQSIDGLVRDNNIANSYKLVASGSSSTYLFASASVVSSGSSYDWSAEGYTSSISQENSQNIGVITTGAAGIGSNSFVFEAWINIRQAFTNPPFHSFLFGEVSGDYLTCQYTTGGVFRFFVNGTNTWSTTPNATLTQGTWYHLAYVKSGTNVSVYLNGNRIGVGTRASSVTNNPGGFWNIMGVNSGNNNDGLRKNVQDFRFYVGTDKGYTGSTITVPDSIVEQT